MTTIIRFARDPRDTRLRAIDPGNVTRDDVEAGTMLTFLSNAIIAVLIWQQERTIAGRVRSSPVNFDRVAAQLRAVEVELAAAFARQDHLDNTDDADNLPGDIEFEPAPELADDVGGVVEFEAEFDGSPMLPLCPDCGNADGWGQSCARCREVNNRSGLGVPPEETDLQWGLRTYGPEPSP